MATKPAWGGTHPMVTIGGQDDWIYTGGVARTRAAHAKAARSLVFQVKVAKEIRAFRRAPIRGGGKLRIVYGIIELFVLIKSIQRIAPMPKPEKVKELDETIKEIERYLREEARRREKILKSRRISPVYPLPDPGISPYPYPERGDPMIPPGPTERDTEKKTKYWFDRLMRYSPRLQRMVRYAELQKR